MKVTIVEGISPTLMPEGPKIEQKILGRAVKIQWYGVLKPGEYTAALKDTDAVITRVGTPFTKEMVRCMRKARIIANLGVGYDHIDIKTARDMNIAVCNVPDYGTEEVADSALAMLLAHQRKIFLYNYRVHTSHVAWDWRLHVPVFRANQISVGIVGLGRIGTAVALRLKPFGYTIRFFDPYVARGIEKALGILRHKKLDELLASSDIVTLHTPLTEETTGMVNERFFECLKPGAILINTARGRIFKDSKVLYTALKQQPHLRIGTDVWPEEPPQENKLFQAWKKRERWLGDRLIITPHSSFYSEKAVYEMRAFAAEIVKEVFCGGKPYNVVNGVTL